MDKFKKTLSEIQREGEKILEKIEYEDNPYYEVDIDYILGAYYDIRIEVAALKWEHGVEGYPCLSGNKIYIDINLMNDDRQERRYRFTLAEELAHIVLHRDIWEEVKTTEDWLDKWEKMSEEDCHQLDRNAKALAAVILMPKYYFINRAVQLRDEYIDIFGFSEKLTDENKSIVKDRIVRTLMDDFNINQQPCEIRLERIERAFGQSLFDMELKPEYLKKRRH